MNDSQYESFLLSENNSIELIRGPPGTGKTSTICSLLRYYIEINMVYIL